MKFMFPRVYRVTQKDFYARPHTSMRAPVVARQISKGYSSSCHVFISMWGVISSNASMIRCLKSARYLSNFSPVHTVLKDGVYIFTAPKAAFLLNIWNIFTAPKAALLLNIWNIFTASLLNTLKTLTFLEAASLFNTLIKIPKQRYSHLGGRNLSGTDFVGWTVERLTRSFSSTGLSSEWEKCTEISEHWKAFHQLTPFQSTYTAHAPKSPCPFLPEQQSAVTVVQHSWRNQICGLPFHCMYLAVSVRARTHKPTHRREGI